MVVTSSIERAVQYYFAITTYLEHRKSQYKAILAFSGEHEFGGEKLTESSINGFSSNEIEKKLKKDPYRFLVVANKFQTGYDEPLLHTMYVDKVLSDIKAVQTLSRLNRAHPQKHDTFVLDFANETELIKEGFSKYYTTTILSDETDPDKLNDLESDIRNYHVFTDYHVDTIVDLYLNGADRDKLDPILDVCTRTYEDELDESGQVDFKSKAKAFTRTYGFLASILPYGNTDWEKLSIFLSMLITKLPAPIEEDLSKGILDAIDLDSYRAEAQATMSIVMEESSSYEIDPAPASAVGGKPEAELDLLSNILMSFHDLFGNIPWKDEDQVKKHIASIPAMVARDKDYQNAMKNSDKQNSRIESEKALNKAIINLMADDMEVFKQFNDNNSFKKWLSDMVFSVTYNKNGKIYTGDTAV
jgi:type I restriction enzyme R subunit